MPRLQLPLQRYGEWILAIVTTCRAPRTHAFGIAIVRRCSIGDGVEIVLVRHGDYAATAEITSQKRQMATTRCRHMGKGFFLHATAGKW